MPNKSWKTILAEMPKLSQIQLDAVKDIVDRHMSHLSSDYYPADEALFLVYRDMDSLLSALEPSNPKPSLAAAETKSP